MRKRKQTLLIVEGNHEKNELFQILFRSFPELSIDMEDVWIYGTNIYMLYQDIVKEYGNRWDESDIDLPLLISAKVLDEKRYKDDFVNIFLVFDYERHDPNFSVEKIERMQMYFSDATDNGQLYINYPMIEAYQDLDDLDAEKYLSKKIPVSFQPGKKYKETVRNTFVDYAVSFFDHIFGLLKDHYHVPNDDLEVAVEKILRVKGDADISIDLSDILCGYVEESQLLTAVYQIRDYINKMGYVSDGLDYWEYMRFLFANIIRINIEKAYSIQKEKSFEEKLLIRSRYEQICLERILHVQNSASEFADGFIWVLNTCVFLVAEYNFNLLSN